MRILKLFLEGYPEARSEGQTPSAIERIIQKETEHFNSSVSITVQKKIPDTTQIPIENPIHWLRIPDVIACFVDMEGSTKLSASTHDRTTAKAYRYFTETAVRIFSEFGSPY